MSDLEHVRRSLRKSPNPPPPMRDFYMPAMPPLGLAATLKTTWQAWRRRRRFRQHVLPLLTHDDTILRDMGYQRSDIEWALRLPLRQDALKALEQLRNATPELRTTIMNQDR